MTTGKTLTLRAWKSHLLTTTAAGSALISLNYNDNAFGADAASPSTANIIAYGGFGISVTIGSYASIASQYEGSINFSVAALKYPYYNHEAGGVAMTTFVAGYET